MIPIQLVANFHKFQGIECVLFFLSALRQWRRGNIALVTTLQVLECLNMVQHLQPKCLEDRFLPQQTRKKGTAEAHSLQHIKHRSSIER